MTLIPLTEAYAIFTPALLVHQLHLNVGKIIMGTKDEADGYLALNDGRQHAKATKLVPEGESDPVRGALLTFVRLNLIEGIPTDRIAIALRAVDSWAAIVDDRRWPTPQRLEVA